MDRLTEFEQLVKDMRYYQAQYFRYREKGLLERSKELERQVDSYLAAKEARLKQPSLF